MGITAAICFSVNFAIVKFDEAPADEIDKDSLNLRNDRFSFFSSKNSEIEWIWFHAGHLLITSRIRISRLIIYSGLYNPAGKIPPSIGLGLCGLACVS